MNASACPSWPFGSLTPLKYGAILADPPWAYSMWSEEGYDKSPEEHYPTMSAEDIGLLPVSHLAAGDCLLWLWCTWPHLEAGLATMRKWGFTYKTGGSWTKTTRTGKRAFGTGYILRSATEPFLIGTIGDPVYRSKSIRNLIESERREHSRKPPEARQMIETLLPDVFCAELFAREPWPGHDVWGNEVGRFGLAAQAGVGDDVAHPAAMVGALGRREAVKPLDGAFEIPAQGALLETSIGDGLGCDQPGDRVVVQGNLVARVSRGDRHRDAEGLVRGMAGQGEQGEGEDQGGAHGGDDSRTGAP